MSRATLGVAVAVLGAPQWDRSFKQENRLTSRELVRRTILQQIELLSNIQVGSWLPTVFWLGRGDLAGIITDLTDAMCLVDREK